LFDLVFRYFLQKAPVMWVKPFLALPVSKRKITHYLLRKSAFSFFNCKPTLSQLKGLIELIQTLIDKCLGAGSVEYCVVPGKRKLGYCKENV